MSASRHISGDENSQANWQFFVNDAIFTLLPNGQALSSDFTGIDFLPVQPYDSDTYFDLKFILPDTDKLAPDDGYEFTFRLKKSRRSC